MEIWNCVGFTLTGVLAVMQALFFSQAVSNFLRIACYLGARGAHTCCVPFPLSQDPRMEWRSRAVWEECLLCLFQSCTNELYDKHHDVSLNPFSLRSITHLRKNQVVINGSGRRCNTPPINSPSVEGKVNFCHFGLTKCAKYCKKCSCFCSYFSLCCYYSHFSD